MTEIEHWVTRKENIDQYMYCKINNIFEYKYGNKEEVMFKINSWKILLQQKTKGFNFVTIYRINN